MEPVPDIDTKLALVPLERKVKLLSNFMSSCAGQALDEHGVVRILNADGTRPPLIWSFNALKEFPALAESLGADQPVIGIRSLNAVVNYEKKLVQEDTEIAAYYAQIIQEHVELDRFWIGGNCQGAAVAANLANCLSLQGKHALGLFQMEWESLLPWPGPCHFLFGEESTGFNPFLRGEDPWPIWNLIHQDVTCHILSGGHGDYFKPHNIPCLIGNLQSKLLQEQPPKCGNADQPRDRAPAWQLPDRVEAETTIHVQTASESGFEGAQIYALWMPHSLAQFVKTEACSIEFDDQDMALSLQAPSDAGIWTLRLFWCDEQSGPMQWESDMRRTWTISVDW